MRGGPTFSAGGLNLKHFTSEICGGITNADRDIYISLAKTEMMLRHLVSLRSISNFSEMERPEKFAGPDQSGENNLDV
jgi:hypothetical protein